MKVIHIIGRKKNGKTSLVVELLEGFRRRGHVVGSIKHCGHNHELDTPDTDSYKHRQAGAATVAAITPTLTALFMTGDAKPNGYDALRSTFRHCELVIIEGDVEGPGPKLEVWRVGAKTTLVAEERDDILGIITDDPVQTDKPVWPRNDLPRLADLVMEMARNI
jgi:molybdopterin-guanine dinucleotide biosynthesis protein B